MRSLLESLLLVLALSTDAFVAALGYGADRIKIPLPSLLLLNAVCSGILAASLLAGTLARPLLPGNLAGILCCALLSLLGVARLFDSRLKRLIRKNRLPSREFVLPALHLRVILSVYADPEQADRDRSRVLSPSEAGALALALSLDSLAAGFGAALSRVNCAQAVPLCFLTGLAAVRLGQRLGNRVAERSGRDLSWLGGLLLLALAALRL